MIIEADRIQKAGNFVDPYPDGYRRLVDGDPLLVRELLKDWGYAYDVANPPEYDDGVVSIAIF